MSETVTESRLPYIYSGRSMEDLPFSVSANPEEFARLAQKVGVPDQAIGNITIRLESFSALAFFFRLGWLGRLGSYPNGQYLHDITTDATEIMLRITRRRSKKSLELLISTAAHELAHYNYFLTHPIRDLVSENKSHRRIAHRAMEKYADRAEKIVRDSREQFTLVSFGNKPRRIRRT